LLIDDDRIPTPEQVRLAFPAPAHIVVVACTGAEGLELVSTVPPDVILLDLRLPDQCGLDVTVGPQNPRPPDAVRLPQGSVAKAYVTNHDGGAVSVVDLDKLEFLDTSAASRKRRPPIPQQQPRSGKNSLVLSFSSERLDEPGSAARSVALRSLKCSRKR
jgi:CheY-like chemotaxis protein